MARKPDLLPAGHLGTRDRIWAAIRSLAADKGTFTRADIEDRAFEMRRFGELLGATFAGEKHIAAEAMKPYLAGLLLAGYLRAEPADKGRRAVQPERARYRLARDVGIDTPRVDRTGREIDDEGRSAMWGVIKVLGEFSLEELRHAAEVPRRSAMNYVQYLVLAGYLSRTVKNAPGRDARYRLIAARYSGPLAPQVLKVRHVYDPNLGRVVWHPEAA